MESKLPTVSVIIPTYNRAHLVTRAICSVLAQTFQDFEILVVDDCSTDNTENVVNSYDDPRVRFMAHEVNRGGSAARNTGIRAASGEYLAFLDSDDEWLPEKLEKQLELFKATGLEKLGLVLCGVSIIENGDVIRVAQMPPSTGGWVYERALQGQVNPPTCSTWLLKRSAFVRVPKFDVTFPSSQDRDYLVQAAKECQVSWVSEPLVTMHVDGVDHVSYGNYGNYVKGRLRFLDKYSMELARFPKVLSGYHQTIARVYRKDGDLSGSRAHLVKAIRAYPKTLKLYVWLFAAVLGPLGYSAVIKGSLLSSRLRRSTAAFLKSLAIVSERDR